MRLAGRRGQAMEKFIRRDSLAAGNGEIKPREGRQLQREPEAWLDSFVRARFPKGWMLLGTYRPRQGLVVPKCALSSPGIGTVNAGRRQQSNACRRFNSQLKPAKDGAKYSKSDPPLKGEGRQQWELHGSLHPSRTSQAMRKGIIPGSMPQSPSSSISGGSRGTWRTDERECSSSGLSPHSINHCCS